MPHQLLRSSEDQRSRPTNRHHLQPHPHSVFGDLSKDFHKSRPRSANTRVHAIKEDAHNRRRSLSPAIRQTTTREQSQRTNLQFGLTTGPTANGNNVRFVPSVYRQDRSRARSVDYNHSPSRLHSNSPSPRHSPRGGRSPRVERKSDVVTKFDPMKDRHMWAMWRTAINDRLTDQIRFKEREANNGGLTAGTDRDNHGGTVFADSPVIYDRDITSSAPMSRLVQLSESSAELVRDMTEHGGGLLRPSQFLYYGIPRVTISDTSTSNAGGSSYNYA